MSDRRNIVPANAAGSDASEVVPFEMTRAENLPDLPDPEDDTAGPDSDWTFWDTQIKAGMTHENRWRVEGLACERLYFGPDNDPGRGGEQTDAAKTNEISDKTALIHGTVDVLKPLIYSETPAPVARRRFHGDGNKDPVATMAAEACQRLAAYFVDTERFDVTMEGARDDWLIPGRGAGRVLYKASFEEQIVTDPMTGAQSVVEVKTDESVLTRPVEWERLLLAPATSWDQLPWLAIEVPMSRVKVKERFGEEIAQAMSFTNLGLEFAQRGISDEDRDRGFASMSADSETGTPVASPYDTASVWEIWSKETGEVIWWSQAYKAGTLDRIPDPLGLEEFYPMPPPLMATRKGQQMTPRPDISYYERRAREIDTATEKMRTILSALSVSGLFPGSMATEVKKLLNGKNEMVPVSDWIGLLEKGGMNGIVQWLPIEAMIKVLQALQMLREQAKEAMFEASGVSDVMRATSDPSETATAQQIKGRYAGLRLSERQRRMAIYARDMIRLMVEVGLEHFDTKTIADICGMDMPMTEAERMMMIAQQDQAKAQFEQLSQMHQAMTQAVQAGQMAGPLPPPPEEPKLEKVPDTSWEAVHARLKTDYGRKITVAIETQSTVLADEQADKEARIEFLGAFANFVSTLAPLAGSGQFDYKTVKELLLFGVRGFPKSRTLEGLISALPDEPQGEPPEETQITVAKIRAEIDKMRMEYDAKNNQADREHEMKMKGTDLLAKSADIAAQAQNAPPPQRETRGS